MTQIKLSLCSVLLLVLFEGGDGYQDIIEDEPLPDYYAVLKVPHTAGLKEIKKSFRKLAMQFHPDKNKEDQAQEIFKEMSEAYSILSNSEKKAEYDELYFFNHQTHEDDIYKYQTHEDDIYKYQTHEDDIYKHPAHGDDIYKDGNDNIIIFETNKEGTDTPEYFDQKQGEEKDAKEERDQEEKKDEDYQDGEKDPEENGEEKVKNVCGDLDDETLFKVLKFLADNDYEITKKKIYSDIPAHKSDQDRMFDESQTRYKRSTNSYRAGEYRSFEGSNGSWKPEFRTRQAEPRASWRPEFQAQTDPRASWRSEFEGEQADPRATWRSGFRTQPSDPRRMSGVNYPRYSDHSRSSSLEHSHCRTTVSWDGATRVTQRSCY